MLVGLLFPSRKLLEIFLAHLCYIPFRSNHFKLNTKFGKVIFPNCSITFYGSYTL